MPEKTSAAKIGVERIIKTSQLIAAVSVICATLGAVWTAALGPGIRIAIQNFIGVTDLSQRLAFVEENMPAPIVTIWDYWDQIEPCNLNDCRYILAGHRTQYGSECGKPSISPEIKVDGRLPKAIAFRKRDQVTLNRDSREFEVNLDIGRGVPPGDHLWRAKLDYPTCPGRNEPVTRITRWFPLRVVSE